jgi:hypothetical protein
MNLWPFKKEPAREFVLVPHSNARAISFLDDVVAELKRLKIA